jgi:hypothetical protein
MDGGVSDELEVEEGEIDEWRLLILDFGFWIFECERKKALFRQFKNEQSEIIVVWAGWWIEGRIVCRSLDHL